MLQAKKFLVIKHGAFGDLIQALGALQAIRCVYPDAHISLLTTPQFASLMARCPDIDAVITDERASYWHVGKVMKLYQTLKRLHVDLVIDLQNSKRTALYRQWIFVNTQWIGRRPSERQPASGFKGLIELLQKHRIPTHYLQQPELSWLIEDVQALLEQQSIKQPYIVLIPGASAAHPEKRWPYYPELILELKKLNIEVVSILGPDELALANHLAGHVLSGLNWFELAGVMRSAQFVIGNDTGPCHLACALNKSGFAIFGPTTSAARSELARGQFKTIETNNLHTLTAAQVLQIALTHKRLAKFNLMV